MLSSVILKESVRGLGRIGEVAKVKPGYARYLLTQKRVIRATKDNLKVLEQERALIEEDNAKRLKDAEALRLSLDGKFLVVVKQSADDGKLFGSVTVKDIAKLLSEQGYNVHYRHIFFNGAIKYLGEYIISLELHSDLIFPITLYVVKTETAAEEVRRNHLNKQKQENVSSLNQEEVHSNEAKVVDGSGEDESLDNVNDSE